MSTHPNPGCLLWGMFYQDGLTGSAWGDWANYTDSPLRAFEETNDVNVNSELWEENIHVPSTWSSQLEK